LGVPVLSVTVSGSGNVSIVNEDAERVRLRMLMPGVSMRGLGLPVTAEGIVIM
jgi:hypothetical protein